MSLALRRSDDFNHDFELSYRWYLEQAGEEVAESFLAAVLATLSQLATHPDLGVQRRFRHPSLRGIRSLKVEAPFGVILVFYRHTETELIAERLMHGARDLPRRLLEPPEASEG
jgi:toxin ParE1/3/4